MVCRPTMFLLMTRCQPTVLAGVSPPIQVQRDSCSIDIDFLLPIKSIYKPNGIDGRTDQFSDKTFRWQLARCVHFVDVVAISFLSVNRLVSISLCLCRLLCYMRQGSFVMAGVCTFVTCISVPVAYYLDLRENVYVFLCFILHSCCINVSTVGWT